MNCTPPPYDAEERYTVAKVPHVPLDKLRDAIAAAKAAGVEVEGKPITLAWALTRGLDLVRTELELYLNGGRSFQAREGELPRGHPWPKRVADAAGGGGG